MYVFKSLNNDDIIISPKEFNYGHSLSLEDFIPNGIQRTRSSKGENLYNSIKHLYYSNYIDGIGGEISIPNNTNVSTNFENYLSTTLNPQRNFPKDNSDIGVVSIPSIMFGDHIKPNTLSIITSNLILRDDGNGIINMEKEGKLLPVGSIIYEHGIIILCPLYNRLVNPGGEKSAYYSVGEYGLSQYGVIVEDEVYSFTDDDLAEVIEGNLVEMYFESSYIIQESLYKCTLESVEFNISQNPTLRKNKGGDLKDFSLIDSFNPYITSVGLYNENNELMAVAKLSQPLPTTNINDMDIVIKIDRL